MVNNITDSLLPTLKTFLLQLDLSPEETTLYSVLIQQGQQTILELSRLSGINRTKIYRVLEQMKKKGLIEEIVDENRMLAKAVGLHQIEYLVQEQEEKGAHLRKLFPMISSLLSSAAMEQSDTKVLFYRGRDGIRQMLWNTLQTDKVGYGYTYRLMAEIVGLDFLKKWRNEWIHRKLLFKDIHSDAYVKSRGDMKDIRLEELSYPQEHFQTRYIPAAILDINHQSDIYNDVLTYYNWYEGEIFGVEIYNHKIARQQKQLFQLVWEKARPL